MKKIITTVSAMTLTIPAGQTQADDNSPAPIMQNSAEWVYANDSHFRGSGFVDITANKSVFLSADNDNSGDITLGDELHYTVEVINNETSSVSGMFVLDVLPSELELNLGTVGVTQGLVINGNMAGDSQDFVYVNLGSIAPEWFAFVEFDVTVTELDPGLNIISNQAEIYGPSGSFFLSDDPSTAGFDSTDVEAFGDLPNLIFADGFDRPPSGGF
ncbi:DUF11 domain-containing protein [Marinicella sediminis]|uniref:DUF11 domain-containing protein n=1 Tax=Marinicella sediminis TaxID=1792834 RepID=A0ABV7JFB8_9GAMM|nr:DUF11 domain-containing protein [Marinicella sediminis]